MSDGCSSDAVSDVDFRLAIRALARGPGPRGRGRVSAPGIFAFRDRLAPRSRAHNVKRSAASCVRRRDTTLHYKSRSAVIGLYRRTKERQGILGPGTVRAWIRRRLGQGKGWREAKAGARQIGFGGKVYRPINVSPSLGLKRVQQHCTAVKRCDFRYLFVAT